MIDSELGEIPSGWKVDELGNYIKIKVVKDLKIKLIKRYRKCGANNWC